MTHIGSILERLRKARHLSLGQLAYKTGVTKGAIHQIESGQTQDPKIGTVARLVNALEVSVDDVLIEAELLPARLRSDDISPEEKRLLDIIRSSPTPRFRNMLLDIIIDLAIVARDADIARLPAEEALRLVADEPEAYQEEEG